LTVCVGRPSLTGLRWIFFHYGPYALELPQTLDPLEGTALIVDGYKDARLYRAAPEAPDGEDWPPATRRLLDEVIRRFAGLDLNELLDHVYFHTPPMRDAIRGEPLDMSRARSEPERRAAPPLPSPVLPADAGGRLADWRRRRLENTRPVPADFGRAFLTDPEEESLPLGDGEGRLMITPDAEAEPPCWVHPQRAGQLRTSSVLRLLRPAPDAFSVMGKCPRCASAPVFARPFAAARPPSSVFARLCLIADMALAKSAIPAPRNRRGPALT